MIGFFPIPYEDELAYSVFARYHSQSGYLCYSSTARDLYINTNNKPSFEFLNRLTDDAITHIVAISGSLENFIVKHTMFNYYSAFLSNSQKKVAFELALQMNIKSLMNALPIPKSKGSRYLSYCPLCVKEDRALYGETYWHRSHQLNRVNVCNKHGCYLINSEVPITSNMPPSLIKAESVINEVDISTKASPTEIDISKYNIEILNFNYSSIIIYNEFSSFIDACLNGTSYLSPRGAKRYISKLSCDFNEFYKDVDLDGFGQEWQIQKVFDKDRMNPFEISLLTHFLGWSIGDVFTGEKCVTKRSAKGFDDAIKRLKSNGYNYRQIAYKLGISYDYCKFLGNGRIKNKNTSTVNRNGGKRIDWESLDEATYSKVVDLIESITNSRGRPKRISIRMVERLVGLKEGQLRKLPRCLECVKANIIPKEEFRVKTISWAIRTLESEGKSINKTNIGNLTNIRKDKLEATIPYLGDEVKNLLIYA